jgi:hypothetical protein
MIFPDEAQRWVGVFIVLDWNVSPGDGRSKQPTNSGGRVLRVDDTYLYLQPFSLSSKTPLSTPGNAVTRLGLQTEEELIPLVDIDTIYPAPLDGMTIDE